MKKIGSLFDLGVAKVLVCFKRRIALSLIAELNRLDDLLQVTTTKYKSTALKIKGFCLNGRKLTFFKFNLLGWFWYGQ